MSAPTWKDRLRGEMSPEMTLEIDTFEGQIDLKKQGKLDDKFFAETRLRRGAYGQRYDNGLRSDGEQQQTLVFPQPLTKGPDTQWDAPGMMRIKIPMGRLSIQQLEVHAELAEEYSDSILHITTRQDIQLHYVHIEDTPDMMRRLAAVGITTREACGNSVRNVTACEYSGVCSTESFDVTPYADACMKYFLGHPDVQDFGRKFKIAFSGCHENPCGLVTFHDLGAVAKIVDGQRGFKVVVGGGLGAVPVEAKVLAEFCPAEELLPLAQAVARVFARLGEKQSRARARIKFLVDKLGLEEFKRLVQVEREGLRVDERWTENLKDLSRLDEKPIRPGAALPTEGPAAFLKWAEYNLKPQVQEGYYTAIVKLPLGDFTSRQARLIADLARDYTGDGIRCTVEQNLAMRWLSGADALSFWERLSAIGFAEAGAGTITDMTSCPGTDTCKLGISSSRGLTAELKRRLTVVEESLDKQVRELRIKSSGCFNSCGQHHAADIGFTGVSRAAGGRKVPHFNVVLGGQWTENAAKYGLVVGAVPSKNIPKTVQAITDHYVANRERGESFRAFIERVGKKDFRAILKPLQAIPSYEEDPSFYSDWGDPREYTIGDIGIGECAGEIVPFVEFGLQAAEQELHGAQDILDSVGGDPATAAAGAFQSMVTAAKALVRHLDKQCRDDADDVALQFKTHVADPGLFNDPFVGNKFAHFFLGLHASQRFVGANKEIAHKCMDEAQLFLDACHATYQRWLEAANRAAE